MTSENTSDIIAEGEQLLEQNQPKDALVKFMECVKLDPKDHRAYFFMARACMELDIPEQVQTFLFEAHTIDPENPRYSEELGVFYYTRGEYEASCRYFSRTGVENINSSDSLKMYAECAEKTGNKAAQIQALKKYLSIDPGQERLKNKLAASQKVERPLGVEVRKKIGIFTINDYFLRDIITHLEERFDVVRYTGSNLSDLAALMDKSDLCWFEWCDNLIVHASKLPKHAPAVCRLHGFEAFTEMPKNVNWNNIDHLIFVCQVIADIVQKNVELKTPVSLIHNGVDFAKYTLPENKIYGKKIAYVGLIKGKKGPELLLQCFAKIHEYDSEYSFHIAGVHQDPLIELYCNHLVAKLKLPVHYYGWVDDIVPWLEDKDYLICSSLIEGFQYSIVESIGRGLLPLVHNWPGSDDFYPEEFLFKTVDECLGLLQRYEQSDKVSLARSYREEMVKRFSLEKQLKEIDSVIEQYL